MRTELENIMDWYEISLDCQKSMKKIINKNPEVIPRRSLLTSKSIEETYELIDTAIMELNNLTIIALVSVFEQMLIAKMTEILKSQIQSTDEVTVRMQEFMIARSEKVRFEDVIDLFSPPVEKDLASLVKQVYRYRNEIAHPKGNRKLVAKIDPRSAYERLSEFTEVIQGKTV